MKNKLIAAMLLLGIQVNGMEEGQSCEISEDISYGRESIEGNDSPYERVDQLEEYYQSESKIKSNKALQDLDGVYNKEVRRSFFEKLVSRNNYFTNDEALLEFIRAAAIAIINLPEYGDEASINCSDDAYVNSPDYVYQPPFLFSLVENLDPITWRYMKRVQASY
jgi:hypothetical protein